MADTFAVRSLHAAMVAKTRADAAITSAEIDLAEAERVLDGRRRNLAAKRSSLDIDARDLRASIDAVDVAIQVVADRQHDLVARKADAAAAAKALADAERAHAAAVEPVDETPATKATGKKKVAV